MSNWSLDQMRELARIVILGLFIFWGGMPALGHSSAEYDEWMAEWNSRVPVGGLSISDPMIDELKDFLERHPPVVTKAVATNRSSVNRGMGANVEQWRGLVATYFSGDQVDRALCIMDHESGGNPSAKNPRSSARGLFQLLGSMWAPYFGVSQDALYDPEVNVRLAARVLAMQGWSAWSPYQRGLCR